MGRSVRRFRAVHYVTLLLDTNAFLWFIEGTSDLDWRLSA